ncbi:MAG: S8 family peptidase [Bryobacteraceae bacterium]|nr:S8 family peptidase [Bryobacteraceae bacterium]
MAGNHNFEHLPLILREQGRAKLNGGGKASPQTIANTNARQAHSTSLITSAQALKTNWETIKAQSAQQGVPIIPRGMPILLQVDPRLDLDVLREKFDFEIVAEQEEGYVIVAAEDIELTPFIQMVNEFAVQIHGSARIAEVHRLFDNPADRLQRILTDRLLEVWPNIADAQLYVVDIGIACSGTREILKRPVRGKRTTDADWARREAEWSQARADAYQTWDLVKQGRETEIEAFAAHYEAEIIHLVDGAPFDAAELPDSFTVRIKISGKGLRDFVLNYPYIFEVVEPEDISLPQNPNAEGAAGAPQIAPIAPDADAPAVCIIDSGIQEGHIFIQPAIDQLASYCYLPGKQATDVGDFVEPGGHGTRVSGAVLYGESVPPNGTPKLPFWIQNARVLNEQNKMPEELFPPEVLRAAVTRFYTGPRRTRIFNHSINAIGYCRTRHMSAWAAEIDLLSATYDILIVQSAGNLPRTGAVPYIGVKDHLDAGRPYPKYLYEDSARVANPAQSLQALTVGSVAYGAFDDGGWRSFGREDGHPSAFSRSGPGIWGVIKPEVVEYGGDDSRTSNDPIDVRDGGIAAACPELVRSTMFPPGPAYDRDAVGTSFASPKVARIAGKLQAALPDEPALLYRALIVQSARWPEWAEVLVTQLRQTTDPEKRYALIQKVSRIIRCLGYGLPDVTRATTNTDHRTTFITNGQMPIRPLEAHIYQVPIPDELRGAGDDYDIRIEVTLSYVAQPRRTRRHLRRYLSTWVDWKSSRLGENLASFRVRALKEVQDGENPQPGATLPWVLQEKSDDGFIRDTKRNNGTVQKDWAVVKSNTLPKDFCVAVVGHQGWSRDPDSTASYSLAVTFEILGQEIPIYDALRTAVIELQELEAETEIKEVEAEAQEEVEIEVDE